MTDWWREQEERQRLERSNRLLLLAVKRWEAIATQEGIPVRAS